MIAKSHRWQKTAVAAAAIALLGLSTPGAWALSLGRITVQSALGEPLRAEIEVPDINADEAASLKTSVASPQAFAAAGLEYNAAIANLQASLQRRADGRAYIRLTSDRPVNDPFVDMIIEASWSSGRILRDYTMLFDPPVSRRAATTAATLPQTSTAPNPGIARTQPSVASDPSRTVAPARPAASTTPARPAVAAQPGDAKRVVVKAGDTAGKIAANSKAAGVSLDQMLVALLRANPDAFVRSNINRIRAGAVLDVPGTEQAQALSAAEATQTVIAQSKDFNEFRRNLATNAPVAEVAAPTRKTTGAIDTKVDDKKTAAVTPDKLTLSKGSVQTKTEDAKIAKERADKEAADRATEIAKNISDLKKLGAASAAKPATAVVASQPKPAAVPAAVAVPAIAVATPPPAPVTPPSTPAAVKPVASAAPVASAPSTPAATQPAASAAPAASAVASAPAAPASAAASVPAKPKAAVPVPAPPQETGFVDELLANPWLPYGAVAFIALLGGFAFWRTRQRKKNQSNMDSSFLESRLQPDSFFGASGGQRVDTNNENSVTGSSMVYSASQLDAADDVDPVAEADVYLAYGRDLQAEEILREAVRTNPGRLAIHTKLLEIFAKRRDAKNFEASAAQAFQLTGANSPDWTRICEMGMGFDPGNPLYQPGGAPAHGAAQPVVANSSFGNSTVPQPVRADAGDSVPGVDLDLDLDFSLDEAPEPARALGAMGNDDHFSQVKVEQTVKMPAAPGSGAHAPMDMDMDFEMPVEVSAPAPLVHTAAPVLHESSSALPEISLSMDLDEPAPIIHEPPHDFNATAPMSVAATTSHTEALDSGMLEFDMGSLSLDLDGPASAQPTASDPLNEDPLETKLALADEFVSIGDEDGARALIEEVVAEATGEMRAKAQRALANLS